MTPEEAEILRRMWKQVGEEKCPHRQLQLEQRENGSLTGKHICIGCGEALTITETD